MKTVRLAVLATVGLVAAATPAAAATPVLANQKYQWFFWVAPILFLSAIGLIFSLSNGYIKKVLIPKYRGRKVEE